MKFLCMALMGLGSAFAKNTYLFFNECGGELCVSKKSMATYRHSADGTKDSYALSSDVRAMIVNSTEDGSASFGVRLERPVFILDGIYLNTDEPRSILDFYEDTEEFGIPEMFTNLGYTPVLVQFTETVKRSVKNNSRLFAELLDFFNHSHQVSFPNAAKDGYVVLGISQGGIIGRYGAYLYDSKRSKTDAPIRLYASLDSPHQGAVMPKSLLETIWFWAKEGGSDDAEAFYDLIKAPGASDLLIRQESRKNEADTDSSRFLFGEYRKACEYKGFPTVLVSQGQMKGKSPEHSANLMVLKREANMGSHTFGSAISRMFSLTSADSMVSHNYMYEFPGSTKMTDAKGNGKLDFIQGSTYPFVNMMYGALRSGFLSNMPNSFDVDFLLGSVSLKSKWLEDSLMEPSSTFIPTASAMDLKCDGDLAMRKDCAYTASAAGFPFENPGDRSSGGKVYAVDPTHPRYASAMSGRHIESPVKKDGSIDSVVLRGMQTDIWRVVCELAKVDYDAALGEFRNPFLTGVFSPKTSCMDASKIPDVIRNSGVLQKSEFPYARYAFNASATEADEEVVFTLPAGWQKVALYDFGEDIPANAIFEVDVKVENAKSNWMKAELMLQRTKGGAAIQMGEVNVSQNEAYQTIRWQMPSQDGALANYRWVRLVLNSAGGKVTLSSPRFVRTLVDVHEIPSGIKNPRIYPSSYEIVPWSDNVKMEKYSDELGEGISLEFSKVFDGAYWDLGSVSLDKYAMLEVIYWPGTCQDTRLYFDSKVIRVANMGDGSVEDDGLVWRTMPLSNLINIDLTPKSSFSVFRLNLQGTEPGEQCVIKSILLK